MQEHIITHMYQWSKNMGGARKASDPSLQILEGYNIIIIMQLSTKAVIQLHKDLLHEYLL